MRSPETGISEDTTHRAAPAPAPMRSPNTGNPMRLVEGEVGTYTLRGLAFKVSSPAWECPDTGEHYNTPEQGNIFLARLHHAWRQHHGIAKESLHERRKQLGLSAAQVSALLGFGVNQYRTYENTNKLPSKSNAVLLRLLLDNGALPALLEAAGATLPAAARRKLHTYLNHTQTSIGLAHLTFTVVAPNGGSEVTSQASYQYQYQQLEPSGEFSNAMAA